MDGETFLPFGSNAGYLAELYQLYLSDPSLVEPEWAEFFRSVGGEAFVAKNGYTNGHAHVATTDGVAVQARAAQSLVGDKLVEAFRGYGHVAARVSPFVAGGLNPVAPAELTPAFYGETRDGHDVSIPGTSFAGRTFSSCQALIDVLRNTYCGSIGFEVMHLTTPEEREWLLSRIEGRTISFSAEHKKEILRELIRAELFESELHKKYVGTKRFSLEGNDTLMPALSVLIREASRLGVKGVVCGMAHRGRLNVLANVMGMPLTRMFEEFEDRSVASVVGAGDMKYHLGYETSCTPQGVRIHAELLPNPSHLEFVNPVVTGVVRALQDTQASGDRSAFMSVAMHGDAAFAGQGIVFETLNYAGVNGYATGGTFHIVINNQIGFTTTPDESRSTRYCTDLAKGMDVPVFHVNAEDPESACWVTMLALEYRMKFGKDVFVDLIGHRKHGHNEGDDPSFTQPLTYAELKGKATIWEQYANRLVQEGVVSKEEVDAQVAEYKREFSAAAEGVGQRLGSEACPVHGRFDIPVSSTAVPKERLLTVARALEQYPDGFKPHPKLAKIIEKRVETVEAGAGIEWGVAEALAYGSLVLDGYPVRLSGQDCCRGTFSHRHLVLDNYEGGDPWSPLRDLISREGASGSFEVYNSTLSEAAILGFEFGYSSANKAALTMWEAQFGDFSNGAQVIIDQFIASSESKWAQRSGVTLMLPHGYEGQGPEHSSARIERYLQLCAEGNMRVCYPSTAAQIFHVLRRQGLAEIKRPLVVFTPKSLLRLPAATSRLDEMVSGGFRPVIETALSGKKSCKTLVLMTGKISHEIEAAAKALGKPSARLLRVEELHPFPKAEIVRILKESGATSAYWVQEEPLNQGAWSYIAPHLKDALGFEPVYIGRPAAASTATGSGKHHAIEQKAIIDEVVRVLSA